LYEKLVAKIGLFFKIGIIYCRFSQGFEVSGIKSGVQGAGCRMDGDSKANLSHISVFNLLYYLCTSYQVIK